MKKLRKWREYLTERLAASREETHNFLEAVMEEFHTYNNPAALLSAIRAVVEAQGGIIELAKRTHMSPDALEKVLSSEKAPHIDTLGTILNALGCRLSIVPIKAEKRSELADEN